MNTFSTKDAENDLKRYREKGPDGTTRALIEAIKAEGVEGRTLLDVGGGIGAIPLELLAARLARADAVDASEAYVAVAREEAARLGYAERTRHVLGRLSDVADAIEPADIVTLDRVVCCDPDLPGLLGTVTARARRVIGLVYPRLTWWNRIAGFVLDGFGRLTGDSTRWYRHSPAEIDALMGAAGFRRRDIDRTLIWHVVLYVRPSPEPIAAE